MRETPDGPHWYAEGKELGVFGGLGFGFDRVQRGYSKHVEKMFEVGLLRGRPASHHARAAARRTRSIDGIDAEVMYGILGIGQRLHDPELIQVVYEVYNTWAADFCKTDPRRFVGLACLPSHDPQAAARELRRAARPRPQGRGLPRLHRRLSRSGTARGTRCGRPPQDCRMPISFHTTGYPVREPADEAMKKEYDLRYRATRTTMFQLCAAEFLASIVFSGALDRFPGFKFVLGEAGVGWLPYILDRMDEEYDDRYYQLELSLKPSELWRRQGYSTYQHEPSVATMIPLIGEDSIMWGSDYPHPGRDLARLAEVDRRGSRGGEPGGAAQDRLRERGQALRPPLGAPPKRAQMGLSAAA